MNKTLSINFILPKKSKIGLFKGFVALLLMGIVPWIPANAAVNKNLVTIAVKNKPVQYVLNEIERQTSYLFIVNSTVDTNRRVSVTAKKKDVRNVLNKVFSGTKVHYAIQERHIILSATAGKDAEDGSAKEEAARAANRDRISGTVIDEDGQPLIGVSLRVRGQNTGVASDLSGNFTLKGDFDDNTVVEAT